MSRVCRHALTCVRWSRRTLRWTAIGCLAFRLNSACPERRSWGWPSSWAATTSRRFEPGKLICSQIAVRWWSSDVFVLLQGVAGVGKEQTLKLIQSLRGQTLLQKYEPLSLTLIIIKHYLNLTTEIIKIWSNTISDTETTSLFQYFCSNYDKTALFLYYWVLIY